MILKHIFLSFWMSFFSLNDNITLSDKFTQLRFVVGWTLEEGCDLLGLICVTVGSFDVPATGVEKGWGSGDSGVRHFVSTAVELFGLSNWIFFLRYRCCWHRCWMWWFSFQNWARRYWCPWCRRLKGLVGFRHWTHQWSLKCWVWSWNNGNVPITWYWLFYKWILE